MDSQGPKAFPKRMSVRDEVQWDGLSKCVMAWVWSSSLQIQTQKTEPGKDLPCGREADQDTSLDLYT